jgi:DNA-binding NarL/FixJ family response regulator
MISLILIDDHPLIRLGLRRYFESWVDLNVVGEFENLATVRNWLAQGNRSDVALLDRWLTDGDGLEVVEPLQQAGAKVIMLTVEEDEIEISAAYEQGVNGYLLKSSDADTVLSTVQAVLKGHSIFPANVLQKIASGEISADPLGALTPREREIASHVAQGLSNKVIGARLSLSDNTVRNHLANIMDKLNLTNRVQVAALALKYLRTK